MTTAVIERGRYQCNHSTALNCIILGDQATTKRRRNVGKDRVMFRVALLLSLAILPAAAHGMESRYDEYLWTKSSWPEFTYRRPRERWRIDDAPLVYQQTERLRSKNCAFISSYGPGHTQRRSLGTEEDTAEWILSMMDKMIDGASAFGNICGLAVEGGWEAILSAVYEREVPGVERLGYLLDDVCIETVENVIKKFTLKNELGEDGVQEWTLVLRKGDDERSYLELEAVELACSRFLRHRRTLFAGALHKAAMEIQKTLELIKERQLENARGQKGENRMLLSLCEDIHPRCEYWADKGECVVNPTYMLEFCRISCGTCDGEPTFQKIGAYLLNRESREELERKNAEIIAELRMDLCVGESSAHSDNSIQEIKSDPLLRANEVTEVTRALYIELRGKCLTVVRGVWTYEICFFSAIRQLRYASDGVTVERSNLIGTYAEQHTHLLGPFKLTEAEMQRMGLLGKRRGYVMQTYEDGDMCEDVMRKRSAVVRLMCSHGLKQGELSPNSLGATVEEPEPCRYLVSIFASWICHYEDYATDHVPVPDVAEL